MPLQNKIYLDPLTALQPSSLPSPQGRMCPSTSKTSPPSQLHPPLSPFMKIATWNVRGVGNACFRLNVQDLINAYGSNILVILEPHISGNHAEHLINQVGLPGHFQVDLIGLSSGIWVLWDNHKCNVDVVQATEQSVAMIIRVPYSSQYTPWLFSAIYASPILHKCMHLWTHLKNVASEYNMPWLVIGDFNELLDTADKIG